MSELSNETTELPWYRGPAFQLLVVLMTVYLVGTFIGSDGLGIHLINLLLLVSLILGVRKITDSPKVLKIAVIIVVVGFAGKIAGQALAIVRSRGATDLARAIEARLALYQSGAPYREKAPAVKKNSP